MYHWYFEQSPICPIPLFSTVSIFLKDLLIVQASEFRQINLKGPIQLLNPFLLAMSRVRNHKFAGVSHKQNPLSRN